MQHIHNRIADVLLQVETTLRIHDRWEPQQPPARWNTSSASTS
jgi:uncharacterized protein YqcC (DUF446 family)